jgi:hypothetical protein
MMITEAQERRVEKALREYRKRYLMKKQNLELDESGTRLMINNFLTDVLGYTELDDIKTEYSIRGAYADYVIQLARKKHFVIEVKSIQLDLNEKHLRQSLNYAVNEGIDWAVLMNGRQIELHRVIFSKPVRSYKVFEFDLTDLSKMRTAANRIAYLTKHSAVKNELEEYWKRFDALTPENLTKQIYSAEVIGSVRRKLKKSTGIYFTPDEIADAVNRLISQEHDYKRPRVIK